MTRVAAFDCGTNSLRLLIADVADDTVAEVTRQTRIVRLGQDVDATGRFAAAALDRTFAATDDYARLLEDHQPERLRFVATSASRDAANRDEFFAGIAERIGITPDVITGIEEAELSFTGATAGIAGQADPPYLVMDLGGGSTELVTGSTRLAAAHSMEIGSVRLTERHIVSDPPTDDEVAAVLADVDQAFDAATASIDMSATRTLVGVAGTITTVTAATLNLDAYRRAAIHRAVLTPAEIAATTDSLVGATRAERRALPYIHPGRADVIGAGALVFQRVVDRVDQLIGGGLTVIASESDILDGIALRLAEAD